MDPFPLQVAQMLPALVQGIRLHHCPVPAAVGVVVHLLLLVEGVVPDLVAVDADDVPFLGPTQDGLAQHVSYYVRKQRHDVNVVEKVHPFTSLRSGEPGGSPSSRLVSTMNSGTAGNHVPVFPTGDDIHIAGRGSEGLQRGFPKPRHCPRPGPPDPKRSARKKAPLPASRHPDEWRPPFLQLHGLVDIVDAGQFGQDTVFVDPGTLYVHGFSIDVQGVKVQQKFRPIGPGDDLHLACNAVGVYNFSSF